MTIIKGEHYSRKIEWVHGFRKGNNITNIKLCIQGWTNVDVQLFV